MTSHASCARKTRISPPVWPLPRKRSPRQWRGPRARRWRWSCPSGSAASRRELFRFSSAPLPLPTGTRDRLSPISLKRPCPLSHIRDENKASFCVFLFVPGRCFITPGHAYSQRERDLGMMDGWDRVERGWEQIWNARNAPHGPRIRNVDRYENEHHFPRFFAFSRKTGRDQHLFGRSLNVNLFDILTPNDRERGKIFVEPSAFRVLFSRSACRLEILPTLSPFSVHAMES